VKRSNWIRKCCSATVLDSKVNVFCLFFYPTDESKRPLFFKKVDFFDSLFKNLSGLQVLCSPIQQWFRRYLSIRKSIAPFFSLKLHPILDNDSDKVKLDVSRKHNTFSWSSSSCQGDFFLSICQFLVISHFSTILVWAVTIIPV